VKEAKRTAPQPTKRRCHWLRTGDRVDSHQAALCNRLSHLVQPHDNPALSTSDGISSRLRNLSPSTQTPGIRSPDTGRYSECSMAEVFGFVASGISVASLAIQILENINRVIDFCKSIKDAPTDIYRILLELQILSNIVSGIQLVFEKRSLPEISEATIKNTLDLVRHDISKLSALSSDLERKLNSEKKITRTWARVQTVLSEKKIGLLKDHLDRAKATLQLLQC
jgi:hypothetical protein